MAWLAGWDWRVELTIDSGDIDVALTDFPVQIYLSNSSGRNNGDVTFVFDELQLDANRKKIAVTTSDEVTECYVEIEKWDDGNEKAWLWVKVPTVASGTDTILYLYFDVGHADNLARVGDTNDVVAENVWDAWFEAVWHMRDGADNQHIWDSTDNDNDGTKTGAGTPAEAAGQIADCQDFPSGLILIDCGNAAGLQFLGDTTVEALVLPDNLYANYGICGKSNLNGTNRLRFETLITSGALHSWKECQNDGGEDVYGDPCSRYEWNYVAFIIGSAGYKLYQAGAESGSDPSVSVMTGGAHQNFYIGVSYGPASPFLGLIDEFRVSSKVRLPEWIKATYESNRDDLVAFGHREPGWGGKISGVTNPAKIMGVGVENIAKVKGVA